MTKIQNIFQWASASIALVPGLAVILTDLATPPGMSRAIYAAIVEAFGAFTFLMLYSNRNRIGAISARKIKRTSIAFFLLFFVSLISYISFYRTQIVYNAKYDTKIFFPFWYGEDLRFMISQSGTKLNAITNYGPQAVSDAIINYQPGMELTSIVFTLVYLIIFSSLVIGFGLLGFKLAFAADSETWNEKTAGTRFKNHSGYN